MNTNITFSTIQSELNSTCKFLGKIPSSIGRVLIEDSLQQSALYAVDNLLTYAGLTDTMFMAYDNLVEDLRFHTDAGTSRELENILFGVYRYCASLYSTCSNCEPRVRLTPEIGISAILIKLASYRARLIKRMQINICTRSTTVKGIVQGSALAPFVNGITTILQLLTGYVYQLKYPGYMNESEITKVQDYILVVMSVILFIARELSRVCLDESSLLNRINDFTNTVR